jgi:hypothetical protein
MIILPRITHRLSIPTYNYKLAVMITPYGQISQMQNDYYANAARILPVDRANSFRVHQHIITGWLNAWEGVQPGDGAANTAREEKQWPSCLSAWMPVAPW